MHHRSVHKPHLIVLKAHQLQPLVSQRPLQKPLQHHPTPPIKNHLQQQRQASRTPPAHPFTHHLPPPPHPHIFPPGPHPPPLPAGAFPPPFPPFFPTRVSRDAAIFTSSSNPAPATCNESTGLSINGSCMGKPRSATRVSACTLLSDPSRPTPRSGTRTAERTAASTDEDYSAKGRHKIAIFTFNGETFPDMHSAWCFYSLIFFSQLNCRFQSFDSNWSKWV